jgi:tight adherence protein C
MAELAQGPVLAIIGGVLFFIAVALIVFGSGGIAGEREFFRRRLAPSSTMLTGGEMRAAGGILLEDGWLKRFENLVTPKSVAELSAIRRRVIQAGYRLPSAVRVYYSAKAVLGLGFALLSAIVVSLVGSGLPVAIVALLIVFATLVGYFLPTFWVERQIEYRRETAELGFPDLLDMILICIEAGNGLDQACRRVAREIKSVNGVLANELGIVNDELWAGKNRSAVFRDFADRLNVADISAFAAVLRQSDEFGVSIAETLRVYALELRNKRLMRAEAKANMMPIKLALGSIAFTIPPTMLIMAGPSVIMILRTFAGLGGH